MQIHLANKSPDKTQEYQGAQMHLHRPFKATECETVVIHLASGYKSLGHFSNLAKRTINPNPFNLIPIPLGTKDQDIHTQEGWVNSGGLINRTFGLQL